MKPTGDDLLRAFYERGYRGAERGVSVDALAGLLNCQPRLVRRLVSEARHEGVPICGHPHTGYYIAETQEELLNTCAFLRARAMHSLVLESRLRKIPLPDLIGQLRLNT